MSERVNHPPHYQHPSGIECIQVVRHMNFNLGNVIKYLWRAGQKPGVEVMEDLRKAQWYLNDEIERIEGIRQSSPLPHLPDWEVDDEWMWWAVDEDGRAFYYIGKPGSGSMDGKWRDLRFNTFILDEKYDDRVHGLSSRWKETLRERPLR
jgi:hypothetical protein